MRLPLISQTSTEPSCRTTGPSGNSSPSFSSRPSAIALLLLLLLRPDPCLHRAARRAAAVHERGIERHGERAVGAECDQPAVEARDRVGRSRGQRPARVANAGGDLVGDRAADELLAGAGARDGRMLVGPGAGADHRSVAHPPRKLAADAAGGCRGRQLPGRVERDRTNRPVVGVPSTFAIGHEPFGVGELERHVGGELLRALADEQHVRGFLHDRPRQRDRAADARDARAGAGLAARAVHDGGVHLDASLGCQHRPAPRVEQRGLLEHADSRLRRVERRPAASEQLVTGQQCVAQGTVVRGLVLDAAAGRIPRATVHEKDGCDSAHGRDPAMPRQAARVRGVADPNRKGGGGLSMRTLAIASVASLTAAMVTSRFFPPGTIYASALTPVIVAAVSEMLNRPVDRVTELRRQRRTMVLEARTLEHARVFGDEPSPLAGAPGFAHGSDAEDTLNGNGAGVGAPITIHGRDRSGIRRVFHPKVWIVTGLVAFAIAAAVLTLPELIFGGAVATHHRTTFFGGGASSKQSTKTSTTPTQTQTTPAATQTAPAQAPQTTTTE